MSEFARALVMTPSRHVVPGYLWDWIGDSLGEDFKDLANAMEPPETPRKKYAQQASDASKEVFKKPCLIVRFMRVGALANPQDKVIDLAWMAWNLLAWHVADFDPTEPVARREIAPLMCPCEDRADEAETEQVRYEAAILHVDPLNQGNEFTAWLRNRFTRNDRAAIPRHRKKRIMARDGRFEQAQKDALCDQYPLYVDTQDLRGGIGRFLVRKPQFHPMTIAAEATADQLAAVLTGQDFDNGRYVLVLSDDRRRYADVETVDVEVGADAIIRVRRGSCLSGPGGAHLTFWIFDKDRTLALAEDAAGERPAEKPPARQDKGELVLGIKGLR